MARLALTVAVLGAALYAAAVAFALGQPPDASFTLKVADQPIKKPTPGQTFTLTSTSTDPDDDIVTTEWDLDDNDVYGEAGETGTTVTHSFATAGTYEVKLRVVDSESTPDVEAKMVTVEANLKPTASFTAPSPSPPGPVTLDGSGTTDPQGDDTITAYEWDTDNDGFYDDANGKIVNPSLGAGEYDVQLRATDEHGESDASDQQTIVVNTDPNAAFTPPNPGQGDSATFTSASTDADAGQSLTHEWEFAGDADGMAAPADATGASVNHTFPDDQTYAVKLTVTDNLDGNDSVQQNVDVTNDAPTAAFTTPSQPQIGVGAVYDGSGDDPDGSDAALDYQWNFDGDSQFGEEISGPDGPDPSFTYNTNGQKTVQLKVVDEDSGESAVASHNVYVNAPPEVTNISHGAPVQNANTSYTATATDDDGDTLSYAWDIDADGFDDGSGASPNLHFPDSGSYDVRVRTTDTRGGQDIETQGVVVPNQTPNAGITTDPDPPTVVSGQPVTFTSTSSDPDGTIAPGDVKWDLDDNGVFGEAGELGVEVSKKYADDTTVTLQVKDDDGTFDTETVDVNWVDGIPPFAQFNFFPQSPVAGDTVNFTSTSSDADGPIVDTFWDLDGDGSFGEATAGERGTSVSRVFGAAGSYTVGLRVTDFDGVADTEFQTVAVAAKPVPAPAAPPATQSPASGGGGTTVKAAPQLLNPFPIVRVRGRLTRGGGTRITVLTVEVPRGVTVTVLCRGRGCPFKTKSQSAARTRVRITELSRTLRPGVKITILVQKEGAIGKYTRFQIRRGKAPLRRDACLAPGSKRPRPCPG